MGLLDKLKENIQFKRRYTLGEVMGVGSFGSVRMAFDKETKTQVAVKVISKKTLGDKEQFIKNEITVLKGLDHPNIVKFIDTYESSKSFYIVTELATGGELFDRIVEQVSFTEKDAKAIIYQLVSAVAYLHSKSIVHRDIKPENILYKTLDEDSPIVLADFGIAKKLSRESPVIVDYAGSFLYSSPEMYTDESYDYKADVWSLGVVCYILLCGFNPFRSETIDDFLVEVQSPVIFYKEYWDEISKEAKDFILCCLELDQEARPSSADLLEHAWFSSHGYQSDSSYADGCNLIENIRQGFDARKKLKNAINLVIMKNKFKRLRAMIKEGRDEDDYGDCEENTGSMSDDDLGFNEFNKSDACSSSVESSKEEKSKLLNEAFYNLVLAAKENKSRVKQFQDEQKLLEADKE